MFSVFVILCVLSFIIIAASWAYSNHMGGSCCGSCRSSDTCPIKKCEANRDSKVSYSSDSRACKKTTNNVVNDIKNKDDNDDMRKKN